MGELLREGKNIILFGDFHDYDIGSMEVEGDLIIKKNTEFSGNFRPPQRIKGSFLAEEIKVGGRLDCNGMIVGGAFKVDWSRIGIAFDARGMIVGEQFNLIGTTIENSFDGRKMIVGGFLLAPREVMGPFYGAGIVFGKVMLATTVIKTITETATILCAGELEINPIAKISDKLKEHLWEAHTVLNEVKSGKPLNSFSTILALEVIVNAKECIASLFESVNKEPLAKAVLQRIMKSDEAVTLIAALNE